MKLWWILEVSYTFLNHIQKRDCFKKEAVSFLYIFEMRVVNYLWC